jgi:Flp pilus assembly protein TadB
VTSLLAAVGAVLAVLLLSPRRPSLASVPSAEAAGAGRGRTPGASPLSLSRLRALAALGAGATAALVLPGWYAVPVGVVAAWLVWRRSRSWEDSEVRRRRERLDADLLHVVDLLSAAVSAGASPAFALHEVATLCDDVTAETLLHWSRRLRWGSEPAEVWEDMARHEQLGALGQALLRSATSGAPVAATLDRLAEDERARHRGAVEARVRQIEVKASAPLGLCLLPAFVLLGIVPLVAGAVSGLVLG